MKCDRNFGRGFNRIYDRNLALALRGIFKQHAALFQGLGGEWKPQQALTATSVREFDDAVTRVCFGWPSVDAYYAGECANRSCCLLFVSLLLLVRRCPCSQPALPFASLTLIPTSQAVANPCKYMTVHQKSYASFLRLL